MDMAALLSKIFGTGAPVAGISGGAGSMVPAGGPTGMQKFGSALAMAGDTGSKALGGQGSMLPVTQPAAPAPAAKPDMAALLKAIFSSGGMGGGMAPMPGAHNPIGGSQMNIGTGGRY